MKLILKKSIENDIIFTRPNKGITVIAIDQSTYLFKQRSNT